MMLIPFFHLPCAHPVGRTHLIVPPNSHARLPLSCPTWTSPLTLTLISNDPPDQILSYHLLTARCPQYPMSQSRNTGSTLTSSLCISKPQESPTPASSQIYPFPLLQSAVPSSLSWTYKITSRLASPQLFLSAPFCKHEWQQE